ncbi:MAG: MarR family transcriptional regulator, partial [Candidatus Korarchaeum sp.]|nr:MarR family transcriptional regulator [Candidatus Korarchaeum sp.]MDW8036337.1 winged helix-turn-helix transcriptional regulator [Candidatus Korarchaeum sp.]
YDLAWYYSGNMTLWSKCPSELRLRTLPIYRAPQDFLLIDQRIALSVIRSVTKLLLQYWRIEGKVSIRTFLRTLLAARGYPFIQMSRKEIRTLGSLLRTLLDGGEAKVERLAVKSGQSPASVSRAIRDLIRKGVITGPYVIYPLNLGLSTYIIELENPEEEELRFLDEFPFTYSALVTSSDTYYVNLLVPQHLERAFEELKSDGMRIGKRIALSFDILPHSFSSPELVMEKMLEGYESAGDTPLNLLELSRARKPSIKLYDKDILALKEVEERGKVSRDRMRSMGIPNPAERFAKYRKVSIVVKGYFPTGLGLGEGVIMRIKVPFRDFLRVKRALSSVSSVVLSFTEGELYGITGVAFLRGEILGPFVRSLRTLFGSKLERVELASSLGPSSWQVPVELWNVEEQRFEMDFEAFKRAFSKRLRR